MQTWLFILDLIGVTVFALSGALAAARARLDLFGFAVVGVVTGIGGGTIRDLVLDLPVFWVAQPIYVVVTSLTAAIAFFVAHKLRSRLTALFWADAAGMALFATTGAERALAAGAPPTIAVLMGLLTAAFGGVVRDVLCNEVPLLLRREVYALPAIAGAATVVGLTVLGLGGVVALAVGAAVAFGARALAIVTGWSLPTYNPDRENH